MKIRFNSLLTSDLGANSRVASLVNGKKNFESEGENDENEVGVCRDCVIVGGWNINWRELRFWGAEAGNVEIFNYEPY